MVLMVMIIFSFANAFYLIGKNQLQFDNIATGDRPLYTTMIGSLQYIYMLMLGEVGNTGMFEVGDASNSEYLWVLFLFGSFVIIIHLINMLVALMGDTFNKMKEVQQETKMKMKLNFVIDNWYMNAIGKKKEKIGYLITALFNEEDDEDVEILKDVQEEVWTFIKQRKQTTDNIMTELKKVKLKIAQIEQNAQN